MNDAAFGASARARAAPFATMLALSGAILFGCSSSNDQTPSPGKAGGAVQGDPDTHCNADGGLIKQATDPAACFITDAGAGDAGTAEEYGPTIYNQDGWDDDCKYHLSWTSNPIYRNKNVTFTFDVTRTIDDQPAAGADPYPEGYLANDDTHPIPNSGTTSAEPSPGHYTMGPVRFDAAGRWIFRFHLYGKNCADVVEESPHGHVAFYIDVP